MKKNVSLVLLVLASAGCECFLPSGKAPDGTIVTNPGSVITALVFDRQKALDYFIDELIRETMLHCPGETVFIDADAKSAKAASYILRRAGELSGVSHSATPGGIRLFSRFSGNSWQMELISTDGKSLWKRAISLKPAAGQG